MNAALLLLFLVLLLPLLLLLVVVVMAFFFIRLDGGLDTAFNVGQSNPRLIVAGSNVRRTSDTTSTTVIL